MRRRGHRQAGAARQDRRARRAGGRDLGNRLRLVSPGPTRQEAEAKVARAAADSGRHGNGGGFDQPADNAGRGQHEPGRQPGRRHRLSELAVRLATYRARRLGHDTLGETGSVKVRTFFGLPLPELHRAALGTYIADCAKRAPEFRWTPEANLHLTIRFLGHVEQAVAEGVADRLADADLRAVQLQLGELGTFKRGRLGRVVWLGLRSGQEEIGELAGQVEAESARAGLEPEARRYHAHLTLARARARDGAPLPDLPAPPDLEAWRADELILYRSRLGRGGSVYEPMRRLRLS
ncbi:MAG: RNA 2',3'-cyclic phosphodiesterase [Chloroflexi bacterium]|nr:MAG: RNA 2',3'-cyclic phosphodiesterase [Chloroflexota bacterium]